MKKTLTILTLTLVVLASAVFGQDQNTRARAIRPVKSQITAAQQRLKDSGSYSGPVDGKYNDDFRAALKLFQENNGLTASGRLDEATLGKMSIELTDSQKGIAPSKTSGRRVFRVSKEQVTQAQSLLAGRGLFKGKQDGRYSAELRSSIRNYQTAEGIRRTGSLNRATLEKMGISLTDSQAAIPVDPEDLKPSQAAGATGRRIFRATKDQIAEVQLMLKNKGLYAGEPTGKLDDPTRDAIKEWQNANSVKATGTLNKETLVAMGIKLSSSQSEM